MKKIKEFCSLHKNYLTGLAFVAAVSVSFMLLFFNKSLALQEGWFSIYAKYMLEGMLPYKDFSVITPPLALYMWAAIQYVFGDNFIVFHIADIFSKLLIGVLTYHVFTRFFSAKISAVTAAFSQVMLISVIYDNGVLSYNEYWVILMLAMLIVMLAQLSFYDKNKKFSAGLFALLGALYGVAFLNKQTAGPVNILVSCAVMTLAVYQKTGFKSVFKPFFIMLFSSLAVLLVPFIYMVCNGMLMPFIDNVFFSYGAKGELSDIFKKAFKLLFTYDMVWPAFAALTLAGVLYLIGRERGLEYKINKDSGKTGRFIAAALAVYALIALAAFASVKYVIPQTKDLLYGNTVFANQISSAGVLFAFIIFIYCGFGVLARKAQGGSFRFFAVSAMFLSAVFIHSVSHGFPNGYAYICAFVIALGLSVNTVFNKLKNAALYVVMISCCFMGVAAKMQSPSVFHGWRCGSATGETEYSFIPRLKGIRLPIEEKEMYEDIYKKVHLYTNPDDPVLAFNNNQVFYELLDRKPYSGHISLYYDVSPDYQPLEVLEKMEREGGPKAIVFLRLSPALHSFHEGLFRGGRISGQRMLEDYILSLTSGEYKVVSSFSSYEDIDEAKVASAEEKENYKIYLSKRKEVEKLKEEFAALPARNFLGKIKKSAELDNAVGEGNRAKKKFRRAVYRVNGFLEKNCELMLLIRKDVYEQTEKDA